jgi:hypothetical protein
MGKRKILLITHYSSLITFVLSYRINSDRRVSLTVSLFPLVMLAALLLENHDLCGASMVNHGCRDLGYFATPISVLAATRSQ